MPSMKKLIFLFLVLAASNAFAQKQEFPFPFGEKLSYSAYYHWGLFWLEAGEVRFQVDTLCSNTDTLIQMQSFGKTLPKYEWLYRVRDTFSSLASYPKMEPISFLRANYEGKDWVRNRYRFLYKSDQISRDMLSRSTERKIDTISLSDKNVLDIQTAVYYARMWPLENASQGDVRILKLLMSGEVYKIPLTYKGVVSVKHKNGKTYRCYHLTTEVVEGMIFKANQQIDIYVSADKYRIPLLVKAPILVGQVEGYLKAVKESEFPKAISP